MSGHGEKLGRKQEQAIGALLSEPTIEQAAAKVGIGVSTLRRWLARPDFAEGYQKARRELLDETISRLQSAAHVAVDTLVQLTTHAGRDGDRIRAAVALLNFSFRAAETAHLRETTEGENSAASIKDTSGVVDVLGRRLGQLDAADLRLTEKTRLTASMSDVLLRAIDSDTFSKRLQAVEAILKDRKGAGP